MKTSPAARAYNRRYYAANKANWPDQHGFKRQTHENQFLLQRLGFQFAKQIGFRYTEREIFDALPGEFTHPRQVKSVSMVSLGKVIYRLRKAVQER